MSNTVPTVLDGIHIQIPLNVFNPFLGKRIFNNTGPYPMRRGIVVLKNGMCSLMCSEIWIHNRLKDIIIVTLSCQSLSLPQDQACGHD